MLSRHQAEPSPVLLPVLVGLTMITGVLSSLGAPLIPSVARTLHVSLDSAQWSLTAAQLAAAVTAPIMGRLGDGPRRRETLIVGLLVVLCGGIVAGFADSLLVLLIGRAMQGVGLSLAPVTMAAARDHLPAGKVGPAIGLLSVAGAAAVGAGYPISGLIASTLGIHAAFFFGALISVGALVATMLVVPRSSRANPARLDVTGGFVVAAGLIALLLAIGQGQRWGWGSAAIVGLFAGAAAILSGFVWLQLGRTAPLVDLRQLRLRPVLSADLAAMVLGIAMYMFISLVTEFVQEPKTLSYGLGASSLVAGFCMLPFSVMSLAASRTMSAVMRRLSARVVLVGGSLTIAAAGAFFALAHGAVWEALVTMGVVGTGFGYTFAAIPGLITRAVPSSETGSAMGLYQVIRYIGFSLGSALAATILAANLTPGGANVSEHGYVVALWVGSAICAVAAGVAGVLTRTPTREVPMALPEREREQLAVEDAELGSAGLVGVESLTTADARGRDDRG